MQPKQDLTKSQLFLDDTWVEDQKMLTRVWHKADIFPEPILKPETPWEGINLLMYGTVFRFGDKYRMYYSTGKRGEPSAMCVAESDDGLKWHRPTVGLFEYQGSKNNNIVMSPVNCPSVCYDPEDEAAPFKMITVALGGIHGATSKDGFRWSELHGPIIPKPPSSDVQYIWFSKVDGKYIVTHKTPGGLARRSVAIAESKDFRIFSESRLIITSDLIDPPDTEYHGMVGFPYADIYMGLAERWVNVPNHIELMLAWSHDRKKWHLPPSREAIIGPTYPWNQGWNTASSAGPIKVGNQLNIYFNGQSGSHYHVKGGPNKYQVIGLASITEDRFASITAGFMEGQLVTKTMTWPGGDLLINASTTRNIDGYPLDGGGAMSITLLDGDGNSVDGFSGEDRAIFDGNIPTRLAVDPATIRWPGDRSLNDLAGRSIKLVFHMRDSHLYSFRSSG